MPDPSLATQLLQRSERDDDSHAADLLALVGAELRVLARGYLRRERAGHTLQPTALVNEAYLKLVDSTVLVSGDRERFLGFAARAMRQVLIDYARKHKASRRGGEGWARVSLHPDLVAVGQKDVDLLALNEALDRFAQLDPRAARVVELRFFAGMTTLEAAGVLSVTSRTVENDWFTARSWLGRELSRAKDE